MLITHCLSDLKKAFNYNVEVHKRRDKINQLRSYVWVQREAGQRNKAYALKSKYIAKAILKIKKYKLPIKYWTNQGITYFEYNGEQVSLSWNQQQEILREKIENLEILLRQPEVMPFYLIGYEQHLYSPDQ